VNAASARLLLRAATLAALALLVACAPSRSVRVEPVDAPGRSTGQRPAPQPIPRAGEYVVARGDTLYGIAFRHGLDYREVARRNGIAPPYTIYPGQTLNLGATSARAPARTSRPAAGSGRGVIASTAKPAPPPAAPATNTATPAPPSSKPAATTATPPATPPPATTPTATPAATPPPAALPAGPVRWRWPTSGQLVSRFGAGDPTRQGIGIAGSNGQAVLAAGDGVVVYSGSGLIGYGELVIVKHSDEWLSAYGHNRKRLVNEGQTVKAGQQIAEMGRSGASRDMLHFEIRRNGKPVDPLAHLPAR